MVFVVVSAVAWGHGARPAGAQGATTEPLVAAPASRRTFALTLTEAFDGVPVDTPVTVVRGARPGPALCLIGGVHGDELVGMEVVNRVLERLQPEALSGTVIGAPIVNVPAFRRGSRYLPDRRDLNRFFPGSKSGSLASRMAHVLFERVVRRCQFVIDFHAGSARRSNLAQVRTDLEDPRAAGLAALLGMLAVHKKAQPGSLRAAAAAEGIAAVVVEAGEATRLDESFVAEVLAGTERAMAGLAIAGHADAAPARVAAPVYRHSAWVRADSGGILIGDVSLGATVARGQRLAVVSDPVTGVDAIVLAPVHGLIIGIAVNQVVMPGFGMFHIAHDASRVR